MSGRPASLKTAIEAWGYRHMAKPLFFRQDPEAVHDRMVALGARLAQSGAGRALTRAAFGFGHPMLEQTVDGVVYPNPVGLGAGFDKQGFLADILPEVGFGFIEIGSVTAEPYGGNPKPRLRRLVEHESLLVNYGLKSEGREAVASRLEGREFKVPVGINIASSNLPQVDSYRAAIEDTRLTYERFRGIGSYRTLNLSCPNTANQPWFCAPEPLDELLSVIDPLWDGKPIYLKISPDWPKETISDLVAVARRHKVRGFICTNLTKKNKEAYSREELPPGGLSGRPVQRLSEEMLAHLARESAGSLTLISLGGIFSAEDAYRRIRMGASLVQLVTGMIFQGPQVIGEINRGLVRLLRRDGFAGLKDAVGADL